MDAFGLSELFQWWASIMTIIATYFYTNKRVFPGAIFGLVSQIGWWGFMFLTAAWGLALVNTVMLLMHTRALWRSTREIEFE